MSLILDALRKSERSRQHTLTGQVSAVTPAARTRLPVPWVTLIGILIIANAIALILILWHGSGTTNAPGTQVPVATSREVAPSPAYHPDVRSLAAEAASVVNPTANMAMAPAAAISQPITIVPAPVIPKQPAYANGTAQVTTMPDTAAALETLPLAFQQALPALHLDVHSYSRNPADRFVVINMQRYQAGDTLREGPKVLNIVPQGVILEYNGTTFLLSRP